MTDREAQGKVVVGRLYLRLKCSVVHVPGVKWNTAVTKETLPISLSASSSFQIIDPLHMIPSRLCSILVETLHSNESDITTVSSIGDM